MKDILVAAMNELLPIAVQLASLALAAWIARVAAFAKARWGIEIEARHREALHSALLTGAAAVVTRQMTWDTAKSAVKAYARRSVPDALAALRPDPQVLDDLIESKLREVGAGAKAARHG